MFARLLAVTLYTALTLSKAAENASSSPNGQGDDGSSLSHPEKQTCNSSKPEVINHERLLLRCLMDGYEPSVRPIAKANDTVHVTFTLYLSKLVELDEKLQILTTNAWFHEYWSDPQLRWNPDDYGGINLIRIPVDKIWTPDIVLYNTAADHSDFIINKLAVVKSDGTVIWVPHAMLKSYCHLNFARFPFDTQTCELYFGSWTYDSKSMNIKLGTRNTNNNMYYYMGEEWKLTSMKSRLVNVSYSESDNDNEEYPTLLYTMKLERKYNFQKHIMIGPTVLLAILSIAMFILPPHSQERIHLGIGIILGLLLIFLMMEQELPTEVAQVPLLGMYLFFVFIMDTFGILLSIGVLNCVFREGNSSKVPDWMKNILLNRLGKLLCVKPESYTSLSQDMAPADVMTNERCSSTELRVDTEFSNEAPLPKSPTLALEKVLDEIRRYLKVCAAKSAEVNILEQKPRGLSHRDIVINEWYKVALVLDRLFFWLYICILSIVTIGMLSH